MTLKKTLLLLSLLFACVVAPQGGGYQVPPPTSPAFGAPAGVVIPAGTRMMVRMHSSVYSKQHSAGHRFYMTLEPDLVVDNQTVAPRGSDRGIGKWFEGGQDRSEDWAGRFDPLR